MPCGFNVRYVNTLDMNSIPEYREGNLGVQNLVETYYLCGHLILLILKHTAVFIQDIMICSNWVVFGIFC